MKALTLDDIVARLDRDCPDRKYQILGLEKLKGKTFLQLNCREHGVFKLQASHAFSGVGCKSCSHTRNGNARADSFETAVQKARAVHGDRYEYIELLEVAGRRGIKARCSEHGEFTKSLNKLLSGQGCVTCGKLEGTKAAVATRIRNNKPSHRRATLDIFREKASKTQGNKYQYIKLEMVDKKNTATILCETHGEFTMGAGNHLAGQGCPACGVAARALIRTDTFEDVVAKATKTHGNRYLFTKLIRNPVGGRSKVVAVCPDHGEFTRGASAVVAGFGCPSCGLDTRSKKLRGSYEKYVARATEVHGGKYTYKRVEWKDGTAKVTYDCPVHGEQIQGLYNHINGAECLLCSYVTTGLNGRLKYENVVAKAVEVHGDTYKYLNLDFRGGASHIKYVCQKHGEITQLATAHLAGAGCKRCSLSDSGVRRRYTLESFIAKAKLTHGNSYEYLALDYTSGAARIKYICPLHGEQHQSAALHIYENGCPACTNRISKPNQQIKEYLESLDAEPKLEHRFEGSRKFFDIAVHDAKFVVEYNGNYWHSSGWIPSGQHLEKSRIAEANGYRCIHIRSDEWENKRTAVEYLLKSAAGKISEKVPARKTQVVKPSKLEASRLLDTYHIQGSVLQGEFYGLEEDGQLVAVMVFSSNTSSRREKASDSHVELTRYVTCKQVVGGFTKLLNHFLKENPQVQTIASYSDVRIFQGGVYEKAGFAKMHTTPPDYMYLEGDTLYHKANYQKSKLAKRFGAEACEGKTERQITEEQGIFRVYDCGKTKWLYTRK